MKLKKILAGALVAAMVLTGIPTNGMQVFAWDNDILTSSYTGYQNIDLYTSGSNQNVTVETGSAETRPENGNYPGTNVLDNSMDTDWCTQWGDNCTGEGTKNWIEFRLTEAQTVAGVLYKTNMGANGRVKRAKIEVKREGESTYTTVYETPDTDVWTEAQEEALFTPVENVTSVRFWALATYDNNGNNGQIVQAREMRLVTIPEGVEKVTATSTNETPDLGTTKLHIAHGSDQDSITVASGTPVIYTATVNDSAIFMGWVNESGTVVSSEKTYQTTVTRNLNLTAKFKKQTDTSEMTEIPVTASNASTNSSYTGCEAVMAFDGNASTFWLSNWKGNGRVSESNPMWIQMKFTDGSATVSRNVQKIAYLPRPENTNVPGFGAGKDYKVFVANKTSGEPQASDFVLAAEGTLPFLQTVNVDNIQEIELPYPVQATHVRLQFTSVHSQSSQPFPSASIIKYYAGSEDSAKQIRDVSELVKSADTTKGTVTYSRTKTVEDYVVATQLTATPTSGYQFVKWIVTDLNDTEATPTIITEQNPTVQMDGKHVYTAQFVKATVTGSDSFTLKAWSESADTSYTSGKKQLDITVDKTDGLNIDDIEWVSDNDNIAIVSAVENTDSRKASATVTAVAANADGVSTTTIKATLAGKTLAQWTVTVDDATELQSKITDITSDVGEDISENTLKFKYRSDGEHASDLTAFINAYNAAKTDTTESVGTLLTNLTNVYDNLQPLYKVTVDISGIDGLNLNDVKLESKYTTDNLETNNWLAGSDQTSKWIYVPMIEKVTVSVPEAVNTTDGGSIKFTQWNDITTGTAVKAASVREYSFYIVDKYTYKPQYDTSEPASDIINYCKTKYTKSTKKLSFVAKRNVPRDGYIIREHGVVITDRIGWINHYKNNVDAFKKGAIRTRKSTAKGKAHSGTYEAIMTAKQVGESKEWYGRSYIEYVKVKDGKIETDEKGNEILYTNYSKVVPYPATSSVTN